MLKKLLAVVTPKKSQPKKAPAWGKLKEPRIGVMCHFDASTSDAGAVAWFADPRCNVSYQELVLDNGKRVQIAPRDARAFHAGYCKSSDPERLKYFDANSAFHSISVAATVGEKVTDKQLRAVVEACVQVFDEHGWPLSDASWRIVSHRSEAVHGPSAPASLRGKRGRKDDPEGPDTSHPVMSTQLVRKLVAAHRRLAA